MYVCCKCAREMRCEKNEVGALFGNAHLYPGDRFECPSCGLRILATNGVPVHDPNPRCEVVTMAEES